MSYAQGFARMLRIAHLQSLCSFRQTPGILVPPTEHKKRLLQAAVIVFGAQGGTRIYLERSSICISFHLMLFISNLLPGGFPWKCR